MSGRVRSSEIRRQRREAMASEESPRSQYFTPQSSFRSLDSRLHQPTETSAINRPDHLPRSHSVPTHKKRTTKGGGLTRMLSSCVRCCQANDDDELVAEAPPHRLRSGEIDLQRFEKTEGQIREAHVPCLPPNLPALPQGQTNGPGEIEEEDFRLMENLRRLKRMTGTWQLAKSRSDTFAEMSELLEFNWVFRKALENSDIMQIRVEDQTLHQSGRVFRLIDIVEALDLTGGQVTLRRRDMRRGPLFAKTFLTPTGYINKLQWNEPCAGGLTETMEFSNDGKELEIRQHIYRSDGRSCDLKLIWERRS